jgi:hypothetical protein
VHPAEVAERSLTEEVHRSLADPSIKPGTPLWFELQAKGCALSMLRGMIAANQHHTPQSAERYRRRVLVKNLLEESAYAN